MTAYEDGLLVGFEKMQDIGNIDTGLPLVINQDGTLTYGYDFAGSYRNIRIWNSVLSAQTIQNWASVPITASHPNYTQLLADWNCNDGSGSTLIDSSSNANNAAISNSVVWNNNVNNAFTMYSYQGLPTEPDNAATVLNWMCVPIQPSWELDGVSFVPLCESLSVNENPKSKLAIFPNPANTHFILATDSALIGLEYGLYETSGRRVLSGKITDIETIVKIEGLASGVYLLKTATQTLRVLKN